MRRRLMCAIGVVALLALVPAPPAGASQKSDCRDDPSASITVCITQSYDQNPIGGHTYTSLHSYQFSWTRTDPQVVVSQAKAHAGVCCRVLNDGSISKTEDYDIGFPSSGQVYTEVPSGTTGTSRPTAGTATSAAARRCGSAGEPRAGPSASTSAPAACRPPHRS